MNNEQSTQVGTNFLTNDQIAAGAAIECDHGAPIGRNVAIDVFDAMRAAAPVAAQAGQVAPAEEMARFCPACGLVGDVESDYCDCCPDGNEARRIPKSLAEKCRELFKAALNSGSAAGQVAVPEGGLVPKWAGEFSSHQDWVNRAQRVLAVPSHKPGAICVDAKGRRCFIGADMARARDEGAFPVRYFWECEFAAAPSAPAVAQQAPAAALFIGKVMEKFSALPALFPDGCQEPGALLRHSDVLRILVEASKEAAQASTPAERQEGGAA